MRGVLQGLLKKTMLLKLDLKHERFLKFRIEGGQQSDGVINGPASTVLIVSVNSLDLNPLQDHRK